MGCASSKPLKNQARADGWTTPPSKTKHRKKLSKHDHAVDDHECHFVALTSSSYGLLKIDSPKPSAEIQKKKNTRGLDSLNDMYDKLRKLESTESIPKPWNEVSGYLEVLKPGLEKSNSSPAEGWGARPADRADSEDTETIDVRDMMKDLDEETPRGLSPSKPVSSRATTCSHPGSTNGCVSKQCRGLDKTVSFHTVAELDARLERSNYVARHKVTKGPLQDVGENSTIVGCNRKAEQNGFEKENANPSGPGNAHLREREAVTGTGMRNPFAPPQDNVNPDTSPLEMLAGTHYSPRPKRVKLTLNMDCKNSSSTGASFRWTASTPIGSLSKRGLTNNRDGPNSPLFDPDLLASYEEALEIFSANDWNATFANDDLQQKQIHSDSMELDKGIRRIVEISYTDLNAAVVPTKIDRKLYDPFEIFEVRCPPGGDKTVVLYTTTLRGIRKTFEDCNNVRDILQSFGLSIDERDVSMHLKFRNELRELVGKVVSVPRLFIKGRYIGGVEEVVKFHEDGHLVELVDGLPKEMNGGHCDGCGGVRFVPCLECSGSCKIVNENNKVVRCLDCNENGLIQCPICS